MSRTPDYRLKILNKSTDERNINAGAGWANKDNSITIKVSPGVILLNDKDLLYTLFPIDEYEGGK